MKASNTSTALVQLNAILSEIKADGYPTPEMDRVISQIKKVIRTLNGNAPAKKAPAKKTVAKKANAPAKKTAAKKTAAKK